MRRGTGLRDRLRRLEEAAKGETMTLVCPTCGAEFVAYGDVPLEFIVHETPASILQLFAHEHAPGAFLEKASGLPFLSRAVSGIDSGASPTHAEAGYEDGA